MPVKIFCLKKFTCSPVDGIDNVNISAFSRISDQKILFYADMPENFKERGAFKKIKLKFPKPFQALEKIFLIRKLRPDILFGIGVITDLIFLAFKPKSSKYIITWHTQLRRVSEPGWRVRTPWILRKFIFNRADSFISVSGFSGKSIEKLFPSKKIAPTLVGIEDNLFNPNKKNQPYLAEKYRLDFSAPTVVFVGILHPRKRPDFFINLAKKCQIANFVIVGKKIPPYEFLSDLKQISNLKWIDFMPRQDVAVLLASSDIFVFPSLNEPAGGVILEAMASGCVPVISNSGGNPEFLKDKESGFLVDSVDSKEEELEDFKNKIELLLKYQQLWQKISRAARIEAEKHSWDKVAKEYEKVLLENRE